MKTVIAYIAPLYAALMLAMVIAGMRYQLAPDPTFSRMDVHRYQQSLNIHHIESELPRPAFSELKAGKPRKQAYVDYFLPLIKANNDRIRKQRAFLLAVKSKFDKGEPLSKREHTFIQILNNEFAVKSESLNKQLETLSFRVNEIPVAMALAQGAIESAWGSSRFARKGNNFFGQWCYKKGCGLVPKQRLAGARHEVAKFDSPAQSVKAYFKNINTHRAYKDLRATRHALAKQDKPIPAIPLIQQLGQYSERGQDYINDVISVIRFNKFDKLTGAQS